jgi:FHA domain/Bacterial regulatory proteins, luxR family
MPLLPPTLRHVSPAEVAERLAAERRGVPFVLYLDGDRRQRIVELAGRELSVGRDEENDVPLPWDTEVSRVHAMLERVGTAWTIVDDGLSRNGSFVNGQRLRGRRRLNSGDAITVGGTLIVFVAEARAARTTATTRIGRPPELSPAQRRVLAALCRPVVDGPFVAPATNREIADELVVSEATVKTHVGRILSKLEARDRAQLVVAAYESGLVIPGHR